MDAGNQQEAPRVTVVVVPRDRFGSARESLESILANTPEPHELVYVDGHSPRRLRHWLEEQSQRHGFTLLHSDRYLSPNAARNLGFGAVRTEYVAWVDNDVTVSPGWLGKLLECADETGAAVVGPLTCEGDVNTIHFAGGEAAINERRDNGHVERTVRDRMYLAQRKVASVREELVRKQVSLCEFHAVLARSDAVRAVGGLDEGMLNTREHIDFSLAITANGGTIWVEPDSVVTFNPPSGLNPSDLPYFTLRWSNAWERRSLEHFRGKWDLAENEWFDNRMANLGWRRQSSIIPGLARRLTLGRGSAKVERGLKAVEHRFNDVLTSVRERRRPDEVSASHTA